MFISYVVVLFFLLFKNWKIVFSLEWMKEKIRTFSGFSDLEKKYLKNEISKIMRVGIVQVEKKKYLDKIRLGVVYLLEKLGICCFGNGHLENTISIPASNKRPGIPQGSYAIDPVKFSLFDNETTSRCSLNNRDPSLSIHFCLVAKSNSQ